jgi:hypothetical protein
MVKTTKGQRAALKRVWDRDHAGVASYRRFRNLVQPTFGCDGAIVVLWNGMWLCIETDGYTHS